jgi:hypothetical protein
LSGHELESLESHEGADAEWFLSQDPRTKKTVRRVWRRVPVDPTLGASLTGAPTPFIGKRA